MIQVDLTDTYSTLYFRRYPISILGVADDFCKLVMDRIGGTETYTMHMVVSGAKQPEGREQAYNFALVLLQDDKTEIVPGIYQCRLYYVGDLPDPVPITLYTGDLIDMFDMHCHSGDAAFTIADTRSTYVPGAAITTKYYNG